MKTLSIIPDNNGYNLTNQSGIIINPLVGGKSRQRLDFLGAPKLATVQWTLNQSQFNYLQAFYRYQRRNGGEGFLLDLVVEESAATEHECHFVPGTYRLAEHEGTRYVVTAQLEVKAVEYSPSADETLIDAFTL